MRNVIAVALVGLTALPLQAQVQTFTCAAPGFGVVPPGLIPPGAVAPIPPLLLTSLRKTVINPVLGVADPLTGLPQLDANGMPVQALRADLVDYIANLPAAIQLGKALFWEMQAGSDNKTACATCHFQGGADVRTRNQLNPGTNGFWDKNYFGPNVTLLPGDFPFSTPGADNTDNIVGSQGVRASTFVGISKTGVESTTTPTGFRQVTGKNTPSAVNAVFNHRNFWNGRAQPDFNGVNPFGSRDTSVRVWTLDFRGNPIQVYINVQNASLASQAVGPPLNPVEMSAAGRAFPDLGKKLLLLKPLGLQKVDPTDSVLGPLAGTTTGLTTTYKSMIQAAFQPKWWNSTKSVTVNSKSYTMMQANFSLFWGLSIMLYEATLVSDNTPMDQYLASRVLAVDSTGFPYVASDNATLLDRVVTRLQTDLPGLTRNDILTGLALFELPLPPPVAGGPVPNPFPLPSLISGSALSTATYNPNLVKTAGVGCSACHFPGELTSASVRNLAGHGLEPGDAVLKAAGFDLRMERMFMKFTAVPLGTDVITFDPSSYPVMVTDILAGSPVSPPWDPVPTLPFKLADYDAGPATYDAGWYNIGVRPTTDDFGLGGTDTVGPWSWVRLFQTTLSDPSIIKVPGSGLPCATLGNVNFPFTAVNAAGLPLLSGPLLKNESTDVDGSFKTPGLRNVEVNGPYFHNGGKSTLAQVVDFYDTGGDFANATRAPAIVPLHLAGDEQKSLVAFLLALTDERVLSQQAPFDHPQLIVPNGANPDGTDNTIDFQIPAVGADGSSTSLQRFLSLNPFQP